MITEANKSKLVGITEITKSYLPISRKRARKFALLYLDAKRIGNRIFVERDKLEALLSDPDREKFPLNV
jgi:hypothetical protein